jgi:hypothetical protein
VKRREDNTNDCILTRNNSEHRGANPDIGDCGQSRIILHQRLTTLQRYSPLYWVLSYQVTAASSLATAPTTTVESHHEMEETAGSFEPKEQLSSSPSSSSTLTRDEDGPQQYINRHSTHHSTHLSKAQDDLELAKTISIAEAMSPVREFMFVGLLCSAQFVTQAGLVGTLNILHIIGSELGITDPGVLSWLIAGYSLTVGTFILLSGRCGDLFGYKNMLIIGFMWFAVWNIVAGCSVYAPGNGGQVLFIFSRVLGGIGPAILLPNALGLLGATYSEGKRKDMVFSLFGACAPGK